MNIISTLQEMATLFPMTFALSMLYFCACLYLLISKHARGKFVQMYCPVASSQNAYFESLDAFRGFAALWVASFHIWQLLDLRKNENDSFPLGHGVNAVAIFCIISAFVIRNSLRISSDTYKSVFVYLFRRFLRIYPLYLFTVILLVLIGVLSLDSIIDELLFLRTFTYGPFINPVTWSLQVEVIFYIVLAVFILLVRRSEVRLLLSCAGLLVFFQSNDSRAVGLIKYFFAGMICYEIFLSDYYKKLKVKHAALLLVVGAIVSVYGFSLKQSLNGFIAIGFSALMLAILRLPRISRILASFPLRYLGTISYSIFLLHMFVIGIDSYFFFDRHNIDMLGHIDANLYHFQEPFLMKVHPVLLYLLYIPALLMCSSISYALIERPFLKLKYSFYRVPPKASSQSTWKVVVAVVLVAVVAGHFALSHELVPASQYLSAGVSHFEKQNFQAAIEEMNMAIRKKPDYPEAYKCLAKAYANQKQYDLSLKALDLYWQYSAMTEGSKGTK